MRSCVAKETRFLVVVLVAVMCLTVIVGACSGGGHSTVAPPVPPANQVGAQVVTSQKPGPRVMWARNPRMELFLKQAIAHARGRYKAILAARLLAISNPLPLDPIERIRPDTSQYGDDTAFIGGTHALDYFQTGLPSSCGHLTWTYKTSLMPDISPTFYPAVTTLTGHETISYAVPKTLPPGTIYTSTAQAHCTVPSPSPTPYKHTTQAVALNAVDVNQNNTKTVVITNTSEPKILGQYINLVASPNPAATGYAVYHVLVDDPVVSYIETTNSSTVTHYNDRGSFYTPSNVSFLYDQTFDESIGYSEYWGVFATWYTNWCHGSYLSCFYGDQQVDTTYVIYAPTNVAVTAAVGPVLVTPAPQTGCNNISLVLGIVNQPGSVCNGTAEHGSDWTFTAKGPATSTSAQASLGGQLDMTQLISLTNSMQPLTGATNVPTVAPNTNGALDTCIHYGNIGKSHTALGSSATATWVSFDAPGTVLEPLWRSYTRSDRFNDYFVYRLNDMANTMTAKQNIWVVLGDATWGWSGGTVVQTTPTPSATHIPVWSSPTPSASASAEVLGQPVPTWTSSFNIGNPLNCPTGG